VNKKNRSSQTKSKLVQPKSLAEQAFQRGQMRQLELVNLERPVARAAFEVFGIYRFLQGAVGNPDVKSLAETLTNYDGGLPLVEHIAVVLEQLTSALIELLKEVESHPMTVDPAAFGDLGTGVQQVLTAGSAAELKAALAKHRDYFYNLLPGTSASSGE
jgi:hypothetical protein